MRKDAPDHERHVNPPRVPEHPDEPALKGQLPAQLQAARKITLPADLAEARGAPICIRIAPRMAIEHVRVLQLEAEERLTWHREILDKADVL